MSKNLGQKRSFLYNSSMKHLLIIFSLLLTSISWSKNLNYNDLVFSEEVYYKKFSNLPFTGKVKDKQQDRMKKGKKIILI